MLLGLLSLGLIALVLALPLIARQVGRWRKARAARRAARKGRSTSRSTTPAASAAPSSGHASCSARA